MSKAENPAVQVLDRMVEVALGESAHFKSHADALNIPFETVKSWKRRRKVPLYELEMFSERYGVTIDWLLYGDQPEATQTESHQVNQNVTAYGPAVSATLQSFVKQIGEWVASGQLKDEDIEVLAGIAARLAGPEPAVVTPRPPRARPVVPARPPIPKKAQVYRPGEKPAVAVPRKASKERK